MQAAPVITLKSSQSWAQQGLWDTEDLREPSRRCRAQKETEEASILTSLKVNCGLLTKVHPTVSRDSVQGCRGPAFGSQASPRKRGFGAELARTAGHRQAPTYPHPPLKGQTNHYESD